MSGKFIIKNYARIFYTRVNIVHTWKQDVGVLFQNDFNGERNLKVLCIPILDEKFEKELMKLMEKKNV